MINAIIKISLTFPRRLFVLRRIYTLSKNTYSSLFILLLNRCKFLSRLIWIIIIRNLCLISLMIRRILTHALLTLYWLISWFSGSGWRELALIEVHASLVELRIGPVWISAVLGILGSLRVLLLQVLNECNLVRWWRGDVSCIYILRRDSVLMRMCLWIFDTV